MLLYFRVSICRCYKDHVGYSVHYIVLHQGAALTIKWTLFSPNCGQHITCNVIAYMFDVANTHCNCACSMPLWLSPLLKAAGRLKTDRARRRSAYRLIQRQLVRLNHYNKNVKCCKEICFTIKWHFVVILRSFSTELAAPMKTAGQRTYIQPS